jgi:hypothetical protein
VSGAYSGGYTNDARHLSTSPTPPLKMPLVAIMGIPINIYSINYPEICIRIIFIDTWGKLLLSGWVSTPEIYPVASRFAEEYG